MVFVIVPKGVKISKAYATREEAEASGIEGDVVKVEAAGRKRKREREPIPPQPTPKKKKTLMVYTDGACTNNGKPDARAGIGVYFGSDDSRNICERLRGRQTNNRAEMVAIWRAIIEAGKHTNLVVCTDSMLCVNSITKWMKGWKKRGWKKADGAPVANVDIWKVIDDAISNHRGKLAFKHVKAHCGIPGNEAADQLASTGALKPLNTK